MEPYILFFSHMPQIQWYALIAKQLKSRLGWNMILWVIGEKDRKDAESTKSFDQILNLLEGLDPDKAKRNFPSNIDCLKSFENEKGGLPFFYEDVTIDRHITARKWNLENIVHFAAHILKQMKHEIDKLGGFPKAAFGEANTLHYRFLHRLFEERVPYWNFTVIRQWEGRFFLDMNQSEQWEKCRQLYRQYMEKGIHDEKLYQLAKAKLEHVTKRNEVPFYTQRAPRGSGDIIYKIQFSRIIRVLKERLAFDSAKENLINPQIQTAWELNPLYKAWMTLGNTIRKKYFDRIAGVDISDIGKFATYFLHVQPEYSVEGIAFEYRDQVSLIENISAFLPAGFRLIVKEHKGMIGLRDIFFYNRLKQIPNVIILSDKVMSHELIKKSQFIFTLTGTVALEAIYFGIPAIVFGHVFFDRFEGIYKVDSIRELRKTIHAILTKSDAGASENAAIAVLAAMYESSYPGKISAAYSMEEMGNSKNITLITDAICNELKLIGRINQ